MMIHHNQNATNGTPRIGLPRMKLQPVQHKFMVPKIFEGFSTTTKVTKQREPHIKKELSEKESDSQKFNYLFVPFNSGVGELNEKQKSKGFVQQIQLNKENDQDAGANKLASSYVSAKLYDY